MATVASISQSASPTTVQAPPQVPAAFYCPITHAIMSDPVVAADGFTYDRHAIQAWLDGGHATSPMTNETLEHRLIIPNRTLRSEIVGGRAMVALDPQDVLDLGVGRRCGVTAVAVAPAPAVAPTLAPNPASASVAQVTANQLSMPSQYEDVNVLTRNLMQHVHVIKAELAPSGLTFKSAVPHGSFAVAVFSRRLTTAEAHGTPQYERLSTLVRNDVNQFLNAGDELRALGWSYTDFELRFSMAVVNFRRRCTGSAPRAQHMVTTKRLIKNDIRAVAENAEAMRHQGWSFYALDTIVADFVVVGYMRRFFRDGDEGTVIYEKMSCSCQNNVLTVAAVACQLFTEGWGFDKWHVTAQSVRLDFKRPLHADGSRNFAAPQAPAGAGEQAPGLLQPPRQPLWRRLFTP